MAVTAIKFQDFIEQLGLGVHNLNTNTINLMLSNVAPVNTNTIKANITEIATGGGYAGPIDTQNTWAESSGTGTLSGTKITVTATAGGIATFRYVVLYNDTAASPADALVIAWDLGVAVTLAEGEFVEFKFNNSDTTGTILTMAWT